MYHSKKRGKHGKAARRCTARSEREPSRPPQEIEGGRLDLCRTRNSSGPSELAQRKVGRRTQKAHPANHSRALASSEEIKGLALVGKAGCYCPCAMVGLAHCENERLSNKLFNGWRNHNDFFEISIGFCFIRCCFVLCYAYLGGKSDRALGECR